jgi:hypothetical protein
MPATIPGAISTIDADSVTALLSSSGDREFVTDYAPAHQISFVLATHPRRWQEGPFPKGDLEPARLMLYRYLSEPPSIMM